MQLALPLDWTIAPVPFIPLAEFVATPIHCACKRCKEPLDFHEDNFAEDIGPCCDNCYEDNVIVCEHCSKHLFKDDANEHDDNYYCENCWENTTICHQCECVVPLDQSSSNDNCDVFCDDCYNQNYEHCSKCHEEISIDDAHYHNDQTYCLNCLPSFDIYSYNDNVLKHCPKWGKPTDGIYYGVELEVGSTDPDDVVSTYESLGERFCICKEDSSVDGFEIVSAPATLSIQLEKWKRFFDENTYIDIDDEYGMHVHVSRKPLGQLTIGKVLVFVNDPANAAFLDELAEREPNSYCDREAKKISDVKKFRERAALNLGNENTIEFRLFRTCDNFESFARKLIFVHDLIHWARNTSIQDINLISFQRWQTKHKK